MRRDHTECEIVAFFQFATITLKQIHSGATNFTDLHDPVDSMQIAT